MLHEKDEFVFIVSWDSCNCLIFTVLTIMSVGCDDIVLTVLIDVIWENGNITKKMFDMAVNTSTC